MTIHDDENDKKNEKNKENAWAQSIAKLEDIDPPSDLTQRIMSRIKAKATEETPKAKEPLFSGGFKAFIPIAASVVLIIMALPFLFDGLDGFNNKAPSVSPEVQNQTTYSGGTVATQTPETSPYVAQDELDTFFKTWDEELSADEPDNEPLIAYIDSDEPFLYGESDDPLRSLVGF